MILSPQSTRNAGASRTAKAKPLEVRSMARMVSWGERRGTSGCMAESRADSLPFLFELQPPLCDLFRDLIAPAAEERADRNPKGGLVSKPGLKGRRAVPGFVARHLDARGGTEEIGKPRLGQVRMAAITAEVVIEWLSVKVCHG